MRLSRFLKVPRRILPPSTPLLPLLLPPIYSITLENRYSTSPVLTSWQMQWLRYLELSIEAKLSLVQFIRINRRKPSTGDEVFTITDQELVDQGLPFRIVVGQGQAIEFAR